MNAIFWAGIIIDALWPRIFSMRKYLSFCGAENFFQFKPSPQKAGINAPALGRLRACRAYRNGGNEKLSANPFAIRQCGGEAFSRSLRFCTVGVT
jgi:hypothetical protein